MECLESLLVTVISRKERSFISKARVQTILSGLIFNKLPWKTLFSITAEIKLIVEVKAWKSPVKWRLISSLGIMVLFKAPTAPPLTPKTGPKDGSLKTAKELTPILDKPSCKPMVVVVLPSPALVGVIAVTKTNLPSFLFLSSSLMAKSIFALSKP